MYCPAEETPSIIPVKCVFIDVNCLGFCMTLKVVFDYLKSNRNSTFYRGPPGIIMTAKSAHKH